MFTTGLESIPLLGFAMTPTIRFKHHPLWMPTASTCTNVLYLPTVDTLTDQVPSEAVLFTHFDGSFTTEFFGNS